MLRRGKGISKSAGIQKYSNRNSGEKIYALVGADPQYDGRIPSQVMTYLELSQAINAWPRIVRQQTPLFKKVRRGHADPPLAIPATRCRLARHHKLSQSGNLPKRSRTLPAAAQVRPGWPQPLGGQRQMDLTIYRSCANALQ